MLLIATSTAMSWLLAYENIPQTVSDGLLAISDNPIVILLMINLALLLIGAFLDMTPAVLIFTPIFLPVAAELGMSPLHFGIMLVLNLCIGLCSPPVGSILFVSSAIGETTVGRIVRPLLPMVRRDVCGAIDCDLCTRHRRMAAAGVRLVRLGRTHEIRAVNNEIAVCHHTNFPDSLIAAGSWRETFIDCCYWLAQESLLHSSQPLKSVPISSC